MSLLSLNQTEKIDHEVQASACRIESLSEQWLTFQMNEFSPYLGMTPYSTLLAQEIANGVTIGFRMVNEKERVCNVEILPLLTSMAQNLDRIKARFGSGYLDRFKGSPNVYPTDVGFSTDASGGISQESGLLVSYGVNLRTLTPGTWQAMTLPEDIKALVGPGVGLRLDAPNFSDVFNTIKSGLRYTTAVALLLAYFAAI